LGNIDRLTFMSRGIGRMLGDDFEDILKRGNLGRRERLGRRSGGCG
jgi:hypothetical protein